MCIFKTVVKLFITFLFITVHTVVCSTFRTTKIKKQSHKSEKDILMR